EVRICERGRGVLEFALEEGGRGIVGIIDQGHAGDVRGDLFQERRQFSDDGEFEYRKAGDVFSRMGQARDHASADEVSGHHHQWTRASANTSAPTRGNLPCCARAASGHVATAPQMSAMKWRRLTSSMSSPPEPAVPAYSRLRMHRKRPRSLGQT